MKLSPDLEAACLALASPNGNRLPTGNQLPVRQRRTPKQRAASPAPLDWMISWTVPVRIASEMNDRGHWTVRSKRFKAHKNAVAASILVQGLSGWSPPSYPAVCELMRLGGKPMDPDNLSSGLKGIQDAVSAVLGCDDGDTSRVIWEYRQEPAPEPAVRVTIRGRIGRTIPPQTP